MQFGSHLKALAVLYQRRRRRTHPRTRPEDRLLPLLYPFDDPTPQRSCPTVDEVLAKAQFLSPLLYQIHYIGPVRFEFAHIYSEGSLKSGPYNCNIYHCCNLYISFFFFRKNLFISLVVNYNIRMKLNIYFRKYLTHTIISS